jgi:hypothetical protein
MNDQAQLFLTGSSAILFTIAEESDLAGYDETEGKRAVWSFFTKRKCHKIFQ